MLARLSVAGRTPVRPAGKEAEMPYLVMSGGVAEFAMQYHRTVSLVDRIRDAVAEEYGAPGILVGEGWAEAAELEAVQRKLREVLEFLKGEVSGD